MRWGLPSKKCWAVKKMGWQWSNSEIIQRSVWDDSGRLFWRIVRNPMKSRASVHFRIICEIAEAQWQSILCPEVGCSGVLIYIQAIVAMGLVQGRTAQLYIPDGTCLFCTDLMNPCVGAQVPILRNPEIPANYWKVQVKDSECCIVSF